MNWLQFFNAIFPLMDFFENPSFSNSSFLPSIWIMTTLAIFSISILCFLHSKIKCQKEINRVLGILGDFNSETLAQNFETLNQQLRTDPFIGHFWSEFDETLVKTKDVEGKEEIFNSIDANYFFNEENLIWPKLRKFKVFSLDFYKSVPGILTGLGILGTFVGLIFGLSQINLGTSDINVLKEGVKGLLSGASMAFSTSVWGIGLSIVFLLFKRCQLDDLSKSMNQLQTTIDKLFIHKRPETILSEVLQESKQQTSELKRFNEDLAISIAAALDEKLATRLTPPFEKLLLAIEELTRVGISQIAKTFTEGAGTEIIKLKDVLNRVGETLQNTVSQSQETQLRVTESFNNFLETVKKHHEILQEELQKSLSQLNISLIQVENIVKEAALTAETFAKSATPLKEANIKLIQAIQDIQESYKSFQETIHNSQELLKQYLQSMREIGADLRETSEKTQQAWGMYEDKFRQIKEDLEAVFEELGKGLREYTEITGRGVGEVLGKFDQHVSEVIKHLGGVIEELHERQEEISEEVEKLRELRA